MNDFRHALRQLAKAPGFTAITLLTLALCIGANSAIFSVVHAVLLKPYPWRDSDRLVYVYNTYPLMGLPDAGVSIPDYLDRHEAVRGFADSAIYHYASFNLADSGTAERVSAVRASPSLFSTLQSGAALGRVFTDEEAQPGRDRVVVLSHACWQTRFAGDPGIVGHTLRLNGEPYTVVGVMPRDFYFPAPRIQLWVPFAFTPEQRSDQERGHEFSTMIARLRPDTDLAAIQRELDALQRRNAERLPDSRQFWETSGFGGRVTGFLARNVRDVRSMLWLVQAGVAAALLIGCANVASLLLARALARERELAIRAALGAARSRLVRLLLSESLVLFLVGGALGLLVALGGIRGLSAFGLTLLPRAYGVQLDLTIFGFTLACALATGLAFGAMPAWSASRGEAAGALKESGERASGGRRTQRLRATLVVGEIALAVMLLATASLLIKSVQRLEAQNPGFVAENVLSAKLTLAGPAYEDPSHRTAACERLLEQVRPLPGVTRAAITSSLPFGGSFSQSSYDIDGYTPPAGQPKPHGFRISVTPDYFAALQIPLLRGRTFTAQDDARANPVVIVDRVMADRYWPGEDPIDRVIIRGGGPEPVRCTVIGVVAAAKNQSLENPVSKETLYYPFAQLPDEYATVVVKTTVAAESLVAPIRAAMATVDPAQPLYDVKTLTSRVDEALLARRAPMALLSLFSGVALLLAALGVYGVLAFAVVQRTTEFGIRLALGATPRGIAWLVLRQGTVLVAVGVAAGLAGYLALSRVVGQLLFGVSPADPLALSLAPLVLAAIALLACVLPARRATKVDPMVALRAQ
ncbi:ABC transporter permease [Opitutus terrae]|uniref:Permease n=1 Tax=Opitutus terrae (strain DSM 11246 / JCM 15787 / PB90-1) TaxID=452637 RepID=B1ZWY7_OPITP|nr:ABC transporter permease [Opitutus terrae]ACB75098.1 permease [Opitutus terrae PB90-1]